MDWKFIAAGGGTCMIAVLFALGAVFQRRRARREAAWPTAQGKVLQTALAEQRETENDGNIVTRWQVRIRYEYKVRGVRYVGTRLGGMDTLYPVRVRAEERRARYPIDGAVRVFYDPTNPGKDAVLEPLEGPGPLALAAGFAFALAIGLVFVAAGLPDGTLSKPILRRLPLPAIGASAPFPASAPPPPPTRYARADDGTLIAPNPPSTAPAPVSAAPEEVIHQLRAIAFRIVATLRPEDPAMFADLEAAARAGRVTRGDLQPMLERWDARMQDGPLDGREAGALVAMMRELHARKRLGAGRPEKVPLPPAIPPR